MRCLLIIIIMFLQSNVVRANEVLFQVTPDEFERTIERAMNLHGKQIPSVKQVCKIETATPVCMKFFAGGVYLHSEYLEDWQGITALTLRQESREGEHAITGAVTWAILLSKTFQFTNPDLNSVELANLLKTVFTQSTDAYVESKESDFESHVEANNILYTVTFSDFTNPTLRLEPSN